MEDYIGRINRVIDYIEKNLANSFTLDELAGVAHFSKYHFHRIFFSLMGETIMRFIQRVRLERAAARLWHELKTPITSIALDFGFTNSAAFSRTFKQKFDCTPSAWRKKALYSNQLQLNSNFGITQSNHLKEIPVSPSYIGLENNVQKWKLTAGDKTQFIDVVDQPAKTVVYLRHVGPYKQDIALFEQLNNKLFKWAAPRGLLDFTSTEYLVICHDDPELTDDEKLRISVCLTASDTVDVDGEIGKMTIPAGPYAHVKFRVRPMEIGYSWGWAYGCWLPVSGFMPDDRPCFELYPTVGTACGPDDLVDLEICVPVQVL